ncbi:hypothetical protein ACIQGT_36540 [Streptomyces sp. NPDC093108]|uniref:hypothetical protein n=1 Tax=Streptomyces sp. NPDC093108 TaxID=3366030 RepID=UPI0038233F28
MAEVAAGLAAAEAGTRAPVSAAELAALYNVSTRTAERITPKARKASAGPGL